MVLADSAVWINHLRQRDAVLEELIAREEVLSHPYVVGEIALGSLRDRATIVTDLEDLPQAAVAGHGEAMELIERRHLFGLGIGYVDLHLLASTLLTPEARLWSADRRLAAAATRLGVAYAPN